MPDTDLLPAILEELRELRAGQERIERLLQGDRDNDDSALLSAIAGAVGSEPFSCSEAVEHIPVRIAANTSSPEQLGKRLAALQDRVLAGGLRVRREGRRMWRVQAVTRLAVTP